MCVPTSLAYSLIYPFARLSVHLIEYLSLFLCYCCCLQTHTNDDDDDAWVCVCVCKCVWYAEFDDCISTTMFNMAAHINALHMQPTTTCNRRHRHRHCHSHSLRAHSMQLFNFHPRRMHVYIRTLGRTNGLYAIAICHHHGCCIKFSIAFFVQIYVYLFIYILLKTEKKNCQTNKRFTHIYIMHLVRDWQEEIKYEKKIHSNTHFTLLSHI